MKAEITHDSYDCNPFMFVLPLTWLNAECRKAVAQDTPEIAFRKFANAYSEGKTDEYYELLTAWGRRQELVGFLDCPGFFRDKDFVDRVKSSCKAERVRLLHQQFNNWFDGQSFDEVAIRRQQLEDDLLLCVTNARKFLHESVKEALSKGEKRGEFSELTNVTVDGDTAFGMSTWIGNDDGEEIRVKVKFVFRKLLGKWRVEFGEFWYQTR